MLNAIELQVLKLIADNPEISLSKGKNKNSKQFEIAQTAYSLHSRGFVTSTHVYGANKYAITESGSTELRNCAEMEAALKIDVITPAQAIRQRTRAIDGKYSKMYPCECCGKRIATLYYDEETDMELCDTCTKKPVAKRTGKKRNKKNK